MNIKSTRSFSPTAHSSQTVRPPEQADYHQSQLPCQTKDYVLKTKKDVNLSNPSLDTYYQVCGASGAARGAVAGHAAVLVGGAALGATLTGAFLPQAGVLGGVAGGVAGLVAGGYLQSKTMIGRRVGSVVGAAVGSAAAPMMKRFGVPISEERARITENFGIGRLIKNGGDFFHSSIPEITREESQQFVDTLRPGDVVLTKHEGSTIFNLLTYIPSGEYDFNHSILYLGDGQAIEATTGKGVHEFDLVEELTHKHHAIAVRTKVQEEQVEDVLQAAKEFKGKTYDYLFRNTTDTIYCSELISHAYKEGAPQVKFNERSFFSKVFVLPGDLRITDGQVVAEAGEHHSYLNGMAAKFS